MEFISLVRHYMIGFVAIPNSQSESPWPCGSATLVTVNGGYYFLTAAHVWKELRKFKFVGVTLVENLDQRFAIETEHLMATGPPKPAKKKTVPI